MEKKQKKHNVFHWLAVVLIRAIKFVFGVVLGAYFFSFGFLLSRTTVNSFVAEDLLEKIGSYLLTYVPYLPLLKTKTVDLLSLNTGGLATWWTMVVGIPLMLIGLGAFLINFLNFLLSVFSYLYNLTHCPWYEWHKLTVEVLKNGKGAYQRK